MYPSSNQTDPLKQNIGYTLLFLVLMCFISSCNSTSSTAAVTPTSQIAHISPTVAIVATATKNVTTSADPAAPVTGPTTLGQPLSHFTQKFGAPSSANSGLYHLGQASDMTVFAFQKDHYLISAMIYTVGNDGWKTLDQAKDVCQQFLPSDAVYQRDIKITSPTDGSITADEQVYYSASIAPLFAASAFYDENGNQDKTGTFGMVFHYSIVGDGSIIDCGPQVGMEGK